jgi:hypothetical protein
MVRSPLEEVERGTMTRHGIHVTVGRWQPPIVVVFFWAFLGVGTMICAWSFATPIGGAPDEPDHLAQAVAVVRGQFDEPTHQSILGQLATVRVPGWAGDNRIPCFVLADLFTHPVQTGVATACPDHFADTTKTVSVATQYSNVPPLYYLVAGIPSLFLSGESAVYAMRLTAGLLNAGLVALGISLLIRYHPRRTPLVGVLIALSPMVLFLMAVLNSSGLEISSGFATWCGALCVAEHPKLPPGLAIGTAVATVVLVLTRSTSPLDAAIIAVTVAFLIGWRGLRQMLHSHLALLWVPVVVAVIVAAGFLLIVGLPPLVGVAPRHPASLLSNMWTTLRLTGPRLLQCIGDFGWLDTPVPIWVMVVWTTCVAGLTAFALAISAPCRRAIPVLALLVVAMTLAVESPKMNSAGPWWQGRYWLPLLVGFPLVASTLQLRGRADGHRRSGWVGPAAVLGLGSVLLAAQIASFAHALTRYEIGLGVPAGSPTVWSPPGGSDLVMVAFVIGAIVTLALVVFMTVVRREVDPVIGLKSGSERDALELV